ncbi:peptidoglycan-binding domain-containing protein [Exiguobacterium sp. SL14]|nr:peptidoglycan-binding domain-containing protein [Exiguobacterium sp. SL14]MCY1690762.1 peptidoglycan-binding domain-containing protein [Exiguobacterium sp. SL14]
MYRTQDPKKMLKKDVERIQRAVGASVTGKYDMATEKAVEAYQKRKKLDADGVVGLTTWNMLF